MKKINELYGFTHKDFLALTGKYDVFATELKSNLYLQLGDKDSKIQELMDQLHEITSSRSWQVAVFMRRIRVYLLPPGSQQARVLQKISSIFFVPINSRRSR
jgi:hypothetical protein